MTDEPGTSTPRVAEETAEDTLVPTGDTGDQSEDQIGALTGELAREIGAVRGVVRLVPSLTGRIREFGGQYLPSAVTRRVQLDGDKQNLGQGVSVTVEPTGAVVTVDLTASLAESVVDTAERVQAAVHRVLEKHGLVPLTTTVSILELQA